MKSDLPKLKVKLLYQDILFILTENTIFIFKCAYKQIWFVCSHLCKHFGMLEARHCNFTKNQLNICYWGINAHSSSPDTGAVIWLCKFAVESTEAGCCVLSNTAPCPPLFPPSYFKQEISLWDVESLKANLELRHSAQRNRKDCTTTLWKCSNQTTDKKHFTMATS